MSKKSMSIDNSPYRLYFGRLMQRIGALPRVDFTGRSISLEARILLPSPDPVSAEVQIILIVSNDRSCWIVREFAVHTANPFLVLSGNELLAHYGKRKSNQESDLSKPNDDLWTMTCAANLQALLVAYDNLAKELGLPAIFGH